MPYFLQIFAIFTLFFEPLLRSCSLTSCTYGPDRRRWKTELKKNDAVARTIIYAGRYEKITENDVTRHFYYLHGADGLAAVHVKESGQTDATYYAHADHLGSILKLTNPDGDEVFKASYDAWGKQTVTYRALNFYRGYTGHEHLPEFGLVNMNGRMYDPLLGRMLSADPYVPDPYFSQDYNRYSYARNNPLVYVDPSGENPVLIVAIVIGATAGSYTGYKIADAKGYDFRNWQTWGYMLGGAVIGGASGYLGATIAAGGGFMANTMSIVTSSYTNSMGMTMLSGGMMSPSVSLGVASFDFGTGEWGYLGKKGNKWYQNLGYGLGTMANVSDIINLPFWSGKKDNVIGMYIETYYYKTGTYSNNFIT